MEVRFTLLCRRVDESKVGRIWSRQRSDCTYAELECWLLLITSKQYANFILFVVGAYVKMPMAADNLDLSQLNSDTRYSIMFGPDKCGSNNKIHFIIQYQNPISKEWEEKHFNTTIAMRSDKSKTHLYTLHIKSNNDFEIYVDRKEASRGNLLTHMTPPINPEKYIDDKDDRQPAGNHVHPSFLLRFSLGRRTLYHHSDTLVI